MERPTRRQILSLTAIAMTASVTGCSSSTVTDTVDGAVDELQENLDETSTEDLQRYKLALRGYAIVSMTIAGRIVFLPYPGMRILTVMIMVSSVSAKLVVQYIDDELIHASSRKRLQIASGRRLSVMGTLNSRLKVDSHSSSTWHQRSMPNLLEAKPMLQVGRKNDILGVPGTHWFCPA